MMSIPSSRRMFLLAMLGLIPACMALKLSATLQSAKKESEHISWSNTGLSDNPLLHLALHENAPITLQSDASGLSGNASDIVFYTGLAAFVLSLVGLLGEGNPMIQKSLAAGSCVMYVVLSICLDITIKLSSENWKKFDPSVLAVLGECLKLVFTFTLLSVEMIGENKPSLPSSTDVLHFVPPAVLYALNNILLLNFIANTDIATFGILRETAIVWVAVFWLITFRIDLGWTRYLAIIGVCTFGVLSQFYRSAHLDPSSMWVIIVPCVSSLAGVANERALKSTNLGINVQNAILYTLCGISAGLYVAVTNPALLENPVSFLAKMPHGCVQIIVLQMMLGIIVSRILKHATAIVKQLVVSMRTPFLIAAFFILLNQPINVSDMVFATLVCACATFYTMQGPINVPTKSEGTVNDK